MYRRTYSSSSIEPRSSTATKQATISGHPRTSISWGAAIVLVGAILRDFPGVSLAYRKARSLLGIKLPTGDVYAYPSSQWNQSSATLKPVVSRNVLSANICIFTGTYGIVAPNIGSRLFLLGLHIPILHRLVGDRNQFWLLGSNSFLAYHSTILYNV